MSRSIPATDVHRPSPYGKWYINVKTGKTFIMVVLYSIAVLGLVTAIAVINLHQNCIGKIIRLILTSCYRNDFHCFWSFYVPSQNIRGYFLSLHVRSANLKLLTEVVWLPSSNSTILIHWYQPAFMKTIWRVTISKNCCCVCNIVVRYLCFNLPCTVESFVVTFSAMYQHLLKTKSHC